jgi:hypothetical protein
MVAFSSGEPAAGGVKLEPPVRPLSSAGSGVLVGVVATIALPVASSLAASAVSVMCSFELSSRLSLVIDVGPATPSTESRYLRWNAFKRCRVWLLKTPEAGVVKPSAVRSCWSAVTSLPRIPRDSSRVPNDADENFDVDRLVEVTAGVVVAVVVLAVVVLVLVLVLVVDGVDVVLVGPTAVPPAAAVVGAAVAGEAVTAIANKSAGAAASRRQPVTALKYDKPTLSLSCAYGVSCRARAERVCATPHPVAIRP